MPINRPLARIIFLSFLFSILLFASCDPEESTPPPDKNIFYKKDGRKALSAEYAPLLLDINEDGIIDFNIFFDLTSNASGDRLYGGVNPIGPHLTKSGPSIEENFLGMGFLVAETPLATINNQLNANERWTADHSTLVIRHTANNGAVSYEGSWSEGTSQLVGIQFVSEGKSHFGWLRLQFDKTEEEMTLVDYAFEKTSGTSILAGDH